MCSSLKINKLMCINWNLLHVDPLPLHRAKTVAMSIGRAWLRVWGWYVRTLDSRPLLTQATTTGKFEIASSTLYIMAIG